jgi:hypothetical protein
MRTYSFTLAGARLAYLLTITRADESVIRVTNWGGRAITIGDDTWEPDPALEIGDYTISNNGEIPNLTFKVATRDAGPFPREDVENGLFDRAEAIVYITDARTPTLDDVEIIGKLDGKVEFDLQGNATFELLNSLNLVRDISGRKYQIEDDVHFGDPRRNKIPTFPTVDETSDDLQDVERSTAYLLGERRRFRYDSDDDPSDYHNVYWEVTTAGTTGGSEPGSPSDTPGDTETDGSVTWTVRNAYARAFQVASIISSRRITITVTEPRAVDDDWFAPGFIWMRSGYMKGFQSDVDAYDQSADEITLVIPFGEKLEVGDWGEITPGYDLSLDQAVDKYGSALTSVTEAISADGGANNFRGIPHITGTLNGGAGTFVPGVSVDSAVDEDDPGAGAGGGGGGGEGGGYEGFAVEFEPGST